MTNWHMTWYDRAQKSRRGQNVRISRKRWEAIHTRTCTRRPIFSAITLTPTATYSAQLTTWHCSQCESIALRNARCIGYNMVYSWLCEWNETNCVVISLRNCATHPVAFTTCCHQPVTRTSPPDSEEHPYILDPIIELTVTNPSSTMLF